MKKLLTLIGILVISIAANAQLTVNQSVITASSYKVGDTISVKYTVAKGTTTPRYFWLRYQYNNKALAYVSTTYSQGTSVQTYYTGWTAYRFTANATKSTTSLYEQYLATPWGYATNADWNVGQLTIQRSDASVDGDIATQKYIIKDLSAYNDIHQLDLSYSIDATSAYIAPISTTTGKISLSGVTGNTSQFKVRVLFPSGYDITSHTVALFPIKTDGTIDWNVTPIASKAFDASGEASFTSGVKVGDSLAVWIYGASGKTWMNNIVTVSDAYKAFLGVSQTDISGTATYFTRPTLQKNIGLITKDKGIFSESDSYYMFAYIMGIDVKDKAYIPSNTTSNSFKWFSGLLNQSWLDGVPTYKTKVTSANQAIDMVYAWGGDLDWSHSSHPDTIASRISTNNYSNSIKDGATIKSFSIAPMAYTAPTLEKATLSLTSTLVNGKVVLTTTLTRADLAGIEVILQYDNTKLTLTDVIFDAGSTVTNFSTNNDNRITFGSLDQMRTARIKTGTPYKLIFTPKETLTNTAGLFYTVLSDAIDATGKKINLIVE
jgi:hypothetical protein